MEGDLRGLSSSMRSKSGSVIAARSPRQQSSAPSGFREGPGSTPAMSGSSRAMPFWQSMQVLATVTGDLPARRRSARFAGRIDELSPHMGPALGLAVGAFILGRGSVSAVVRCFRTRRGDTLSAESVRVLRAWAARHMISDASCPGPDRNGCSASDRDASRAAIREYARIDVTC